jgi:NADH pyrophosphatase NudC (nudix superfamily)
MQPFRPPDVRLARDGVARALQHLEEAEQTLARARALVAKLNEWEESVRYCPKCLKTFTPFSALSGRRPGNTC